MKLIRLALLLTLIFNSIVSFSQSTDTLNCKFLRHSKLQYINSQDSTAYVIINDKDHIEYLYGEKYYIKSTLNWLNDCEYEMTMTEITLPNFPFHAGDMMHVKCDSIEGDIINFTGTVKGETFKGQFRVMK